VWEDGVKERKKERKVEQIIGDLIFSGRGNG
jgi:hypothetical protein